MNPIIIDLPRANRFRRNFFLFSAIAVACGAAAVAHSAAGNHLGAFIASIFVLPAAASAYVCILGRAVALTGIAGFPAVRFFGGPWRVIFAKNPPEILPPSNC